MKAKTTAHGAATIVAAFAAGRGGAFGISLETAAEAEIIGGERIHAEIVGHPDEDTTLLGCCAKQVLGYFGVDSGVKIKTESEIPFASGLKSSSTAANAAVSAIACALAKEHGGEILGEDGLHIIVNNREADDLTLINLGVSAAFDAKVTSTGAFDDACASYFGGYVLTDNTTREIVERGEMEPLKVLVFLPEGKSYSGKVDLKKIKSIKKEVEFAWAKASRGNIREALTVNGLVHSLYFGLNPVYAVEALRAGAVASGLSGTGPATVALTDSKETEIKQAWSGFPGKIIETETTNEGVKIK